MDEFFRHIRSFLGLPKFEDRNSNYDQEGMGEPGIFGDTRYDAFSDALQMHRFFEQQMNKIFGEFGLFQFGGENKFLFGDIPGQGEIEFFDNNDSLSSSDSTHELRDEFLKPGFKRPTQRQLEDKSDIELKESDIDLKDLDSICRGKYSRQENPQIKTRIFGQSISTRTIVNPDGSTEIHKTIRDNQGNEETTITRRIGDKEHTIIKKRDSSGKEEITENFVDIEKDVSALLQTPDGTPWSLFQRIFRA